MFEVMAPAKVNLFLQVFGKRKDGYHDIKSLLVPISLYDKVSFEKHDFNVETVMESGGVRLNGISWPVSMPGSADNLTTRAALLLREASGYKGGAKIHIEKNIPVSGGLGGGSSDAATVLKSLNELWETGFDLRRLIDMGSALGSDIPAMVHGGGVCMRGRGERISGISVDGARPIWMLLVNPGLEVSTGDIYLRYKPGLTCSEADDKFSSVMSGLKKGCPETIRKGLFNSLQNTAFNKYPLLRIISNELERAGASGVLLSGSGATILALVNDEKHGMEVEARFRAAARCPVWACLVRIIV